MADVEVPDLVGTPEADASTTLTAVKLSVGSVSRLSSSTVAAGTIIGSTPAPRTQVPEGTAVDLEISSGPSASNIPADMAVVPDVSGLTRSATEGALKGMGLKVGSISWSHSDIVPVNGAIRTSPPAGSSIPVGTAVALEISSGPEWKFGQYILPGFFTALGLVVLGFIGYTLYQRNQSFLSSLADKDFARGLITFLIAITTVGIAIILAISTVVTAETSESDRRFDRGKQVLTVLIGVLGTIVGFYFGSAPDSRAPRTEEPQQSSLVMTLPAGKVGSPYPAITLSSAGLTPPITWSISPDLPEDLSLDTQTGTISGTPKSPSARTTYAVEATDSASPPSTLKQSIELEVQQ